MNPFGKTTFLAGSILCSITSGFGNDASLDQLVATLESDDYAARHEARMEIQDRVSIASAPGNNTEQTEIESKLTMYLDSKYLPTTRLWILRQLASIGTDASVDAIAELLDDDNMHISDGARMALESNASDKAFEVLQSNINGSNANDADVLDSDFEALTEQAKEGPDRAARAAAFKKCIQLNPKKSIELLEYAISSEDFDSDSDFVRIGYTSENRKIEGFLQKQLPNLSSKLQGVILAALPPAKSKKLESQILELLANTESEALKRGATDALGRVGSIASLDALLTGLEAKSKTMNETAAFALASIDDPKIDRRLLRDASQGEVEERIAAIKALGYRASGGASNLVTRIAQEDSDPKIQEAALSTIEMIGTTDSYPVLIKLIIEGSESGLRRDAQIAMKRLSLRSEDPDTTWTAFQKGLEDAGEDKEAVLSLVTIIDSASSSDSLDYLRSMWNEGDDSIKKTILKVLPLWRNWEGGEMLVAIAQEPGASEETRNSSFKGIGRLILGSDANYSIEGKFELAAAALEAANTPEERNDVIQGFRYATWRERVFVDYNPVDPELKIAVKEFEKNN